MTINFNGDPWGGMNQAAQRRKAKDPRHALVYRVEAAAIGWANNIGHSRFDGLTLRQILTDGRGNEPSRQIIDKAVRKAKELGLIEPESNSRCLVVSRRTFQRGGRGSYICQVHGISRGR
ncbi:hypothetical protein [Plantactinospora endophytica]|uniref:Uncharacterized protein n=1 Tax=Plantactinospora endophytica TaxID=673535 RepID=A0ABQ4ECC0_9ACTN|nr:hypothetical protein [Plantactinospora endophytica]GIG92377.1 hypothetical protein Pen02_73130 [Plantactinospora endophytica]